MINLKIFEDSFVGKFHILSYKLNMYSKYYLNDVDVFVNAMKRARNTSIDDICN